MEMLFSTDYALPSILVDLAATLLAAGLLSAGGVIWGQEFLRWLRFPLHSRWEFRVLGAALGLGFLALLMLGLAALGLLYRGVAWGVVVATLLAGARARTRRKGPVATPPVSPAPAAPPPWSLLVGEARGAYLRRDFIVSSQFDQNPLAAWANASRSGGELYETLRKAGVTHLLVNIMEMRRLTGYRTLDFDEVGRRVLEEFWRANVEEIFYASEEFKGQEANRIVVYAVADAPAVPRQAPYNPLLDPANGA